MLFPLLCDLEFLKLLVLSGKMEVESRPFLIAFLRSSDSPLQCSYCGKGGHYTARKEAKQRGDRYWYAYLATGTQLTKKYLGKTSDLTLGRLEHIAQELRADLAWGVPPLPGIPPLLAPPALPPPTAVHMQPPVFPTSPTADLETYRARQPFLAQ